MTLPEVRPRVTSHQDHAIICHHLSYAFTTATETVRVIVGSQGRAISGQMIRCWQQKHNLQYCRQLTWPILTARQDSRGWPGLGIVFTRPGDSGGKCSLTTAVSASAKQMTRLESGDGTMKVLLTTSWRSMPGMVTASISWSGTQFNHVMGLVVLGNIGLCRVHGIDEQQYIN